VDKRTNQTVDGHAFPDMDYLWLSRVAKTHPIQGASCYDASMVTSRRAAVEHFGSWKQALRAAGIEPEHLRPYRPDQRPGKQQILQEIARRSREGRSLRWRDVVCENRAFAISAKRAFGTWRAAVEAAGLRPG
jgi:hypothetical protein